MPWLFKKKLMPASSLMGHDWREIPWGGFEKILQEVQNVLKLSSPEVQHLRILIYGPAGAGKSSFINTIDSIFKGRMTNAATVDAATDFSFTKKFQVHKIRDVRSGHLPFAICDVMGLDTDDKGGIHPEDLINILKGHIKDGYKFNPGSPCSGKDTSYNSNPSPSDRIHCLVGIIPADKVSLMDDDFFKKMREIRKQASELRIPEVALLTKIDLACPDVSKDIKLVYRSKKIKEKMEICSNRYGVPMYNIFPVKNYHEEGSMKPELNVLMLSALINILNFANDHVGVSRPPVPSRGARVGHQRTMERAPRFGR